MPSMKAGDWLGCQRAPEAAAAAIEGRMAGFPPVTMIAVVNRQATADKTGNNINCLSERRIAKLCFTSSQLRENLPIASSYDVPCVEALPIVRGQIAGGGCQRP